MIKQLWFFSLVFFIVMYSCKKDEENNGEPSTSRTYRMGFSSSAPRPDFDLVIQSLHLWEQRADAAMISNEVPWDSLLEGSSAVDYVNYNYKGLADYYHSKNFELWVFIDPANGLNRSSDATALVARKKSISQPAIQNIYRRFVFVMDSILQPDHLGLALETNAIRETSPDSIYQGIKKAANDASSVVRAFDKKVKLSISVQVDFAWGKLDNTSYKSVDIDFSDFPFIEELGLSSYPYFAYDRPQDIPLNYYSRLVSKKELPVFVSEGGWTSATVDKFIGTPEKQRDYIIRHAQLLDEVSATGVFQLTFTDFDLSGWPAEIWENIHYFTSLGLVDTDLQPKPALSAWDEIFEREYKGD